MLKLMPTISHVPFFFLQLLEHRRHDVRPAAALCLWHVRADGTQILFVIKYIKRTYRLGVVGLGGPQVLHSYYIGLFQ